MKWFIPIIFLFVSSISMSANSTEIDEIVLGIQPSSGFCYIESDSCLRKSHVEKIMSLKVNKHPVQTETFVGATSLSWQSPLPEIRRIVNYEVKIDYKEWLDPDNSFATHNFVVKIFSHEVNHWIGAARFSVNSLDINSEPSGVTVWGNYKNDSQTYIFGGAKVYIKSVTYK